MRAHTFLILGTLIIPAYLSWGRRQRSWKNWDCLDDAKGRTKRVCLTDDAEIPQGYYQINNKREVFKSTPKTETRCEKAAGKSFCPKTCADGSFCFEQICRPYSPCANADGIVLLVDAVSISALIKHSFRVSNENCLSFFIFCTSLHLVF